MRAQRTAQGSQHCCRSFETRRRKKLKSFRPPYGCARSKVFARLFQTAAGSRARSPRRRPQTAKLLNGVSFCRAFSLRLFQQRKSGYGITLFFHGYVIPDRNLRKKLYYLWVRSSGTTAGRPCFHINFSVRIFIYYAQPWNNCRFLSRFFFGNAGAKKKLSKRNANRSFRRLRTAARAARPRPRHL